MPAIHLARLKKQVAGLLELVDDLPAFGGALINILDEYADRTRRYGQTGEPPPLVNSHNAPSQVLRHITKELSSYVSTNPENSLLLCDYLWNQTYLEENLLAAYLVGYITLADPQPVLERIQEWLITKSEERLVEAILYHSFASLWQNNLEVVIHTIDEWITDSDLHCKSLGLKAMLPLMDQHNFVDLSIIYRWINPLIRSSPSEIQSEVINVLRVLAHRTPSETAYTLRRILETSDDNQAAWYIRQTINYFPTSLQSRLRDSLHENRRRSW